MNSGVNAPRRCFTELFLHRLQYQVSFPLWRRPQHQEHKLSHFKTFGQYEYPVPDNNVLTTWSVFSGPPPVSCTNEATGNLGLEQPEITDWTMLCDTPEARGSWRFFYCSHFYKSRKDFFFSHICQTFLHIELYLATWVGWKHAFHLTIFASHAFCLIHLRYRNTSICCLRVHHFVQGKKRKRTLRWPSCIWTLNQVHIRVYWCQPELMLHNW